MPSASPRAPARVGICATTPEGESHEPDAGSASLPDPQKYIPGYRQLSDLGATFYPVNPDKSPAVSGKRSREATIDPSKIRYWSEHQHFHSFAMHIPRTAKILVIDTESSFKCGKLGPDGELIFCELIEESDITLPPCPMTQTASGGFHRYFVVPKGFRVTSTIGLWPGVDILAGGSNVILPGSRTAGGEYRMLQSFDDCVIPEAPRKLIKLIKSRQKSIHSSKARPSEFPIPYGDTPVVSRRQWYLLFRSRSFCSRWYRQSKLGDRSDSAYQYHLAKACFCCGLTVAQIVYVIERWWIKHGLKPNPKKLEHAIIPSAWDEVASWVNNWRSWHAAQRESRVAKKTSRMIATQIAAAGPQEPAEIASALGIPRERAKKALQRMAKAGRALRSDRGYELASDSGDILRITTLPSDKSPF